MYQEKHNIQPDSAPQPHKPKVVNSTVKRTSDNDNSRKRSAIDMTDEPEQRRTKRPRVDANGSPKAIAKSEHPAVSPSVAINPSPNGRVSDAPDLMSKPQLTHSDEAQPGTSATK